MNEKYLEEHDKKWKTCPTCEGGGMYECKHCGTTQIPCEECKYSGEIER